MISTAILLGSLASAPPPMILHLRADTGLTTDANGRVLRWQDLSGRGTHFRTPKFGNTPDTSACPTTRVLPGWNRSVHFDGHQVLEDSTFLPLDSGFTFLALVQDSAPEAASSLLDKSANDLGINLWDAASGYLTLSWSWNKAIASSYYRSSAPVVYGASWDKYSASLWADDSLLRTISTSTPSNASRNKSTWFGNVSYSKGSSKDIKYGLHGDVWEVRVYAGRLSDSLLKVAVDSMRFRNLGAHLPPPATDTPKVIVPADSTLMLHLRADTGTTSTGSGRLLEWMDLSPRHARFAPPRHDTTLSPLLLISGLGGHPSLKFGTGSIHDGHALQDSSALPLDSGCTILIVAQDSSGKDALTGLLDKGKNDLALALWSGDAGNITFGYSWLQGLVSSPVDTAEPGLLEVSWDGQTAKLRRNGKLIGENAAALAPVAAVRNAVTTIGAVDHIILRYFFTGQLSEIRIYRGVLADSLRRQVEDSLITRYGLSRSDTVSASGIRNSPAPAVRITELPNGMLLVRGTALPLKLADILGRDFPFRATSTAEGILLQPSERLRPGHYLLRTENETSHLILTHP